MSLPVEPNLAQKLPFSFYLSRYVQIPFIFSMLSLGAIGIWKVADLYYRVQLNTARMEILEQRQNLVRDQVVQISLRLAAIDQNMADQDETLDRMEQKVDRLTDLLMGGKK